MLKSLQFGGLAIKLKIKIKIGTKLFITYFILLAITFFIVAVSFNVLSQKYLITETRQQLIEEGKIIEKLFINTPIIDQTVRKTIATKRRIEVANRYVDADVIIMNRDKKIIYSTISIDNFDEVKRLSNKLNNNKEYLSARVPLYNNKKAVKGYVVLFTKIKDIEELNTIMYNTRRISFTMAGLVALIIAFIFQRNLTKPLRKLKDFTKDFSLKNYNQQIDIKTGDEIEELANSFNQMASKLKKYDETQKKFLQNASHELKTPLMAIQGNAEAIKDGVVEGQEVNQSLDVIIEESQRLKKVVDEILYLTKLENVEETFQYERRNIDGLIGNAIKSVKPLADKNEIKINISGNFNYIGQFDGEKLQRAFINILGNGIRYAKANIYIKGNLIGDKIEINFIDDGAGFKDGEEKRIFDRFYKGENGGTGIGLSITKAIINGHDGDISAYNNESNGAVFEIILPIDNK